MGKHWKEKEAAQREQTKTVKEKPPVEYYRSDLFRRMKQHRYGQNVTRLGVREISEVTGLAVNTVTRALKGNSKTSLDTLWKLAKYFGVPWKLVFDIDRNYEVEVDEDGATYVINGMNDWSK